MEKLLAAKRYREAGQIGGRIFENLLKNLYDQIKPNAGKTAVTTIASPEEKLEGFDTDSTNLNLDGLVEQFSEGGRLAMIQSDRVPAIIRAKGIPFKKLLEIRNRCAISVYLPQADEIQLLYSSIKTLIDEMGVADTSSPSSTSEMPRPTALPGSDDQHFCPNCKEPVRNHWKLCPVCETVLDQFSCPQCTRSVKANWKLCPECNARLLCSNCGQRIPHGQQQCSNCKPAQQPAIITEPVTAMEFVQIPAGTFKMGDAFGEGIEDETPLHDVRLRCFRLGITPVTQGQWLQVMHANPSLFKKSARHPVEQVTWDDVQAFIRGLTEMNAGKYKFRLPSEAEWEYAARSGGKIQKYSGGNDAEAVAWFELNSNGSTQPVGRKTSNGLGIYDMSGNVWEWCQDVYHPQAYRNHALENPVWTAAGKERVIRGGSWNLDAWGARCTRRLGYPVDYYGPGLGFRLVLELFDVKK
jgi:formylglycine-generating enzyme required for sulfatase activity